MSKNGLTRFLQWLQQNTVLYFRFVLFITFTGHGLVSLGFSEGYELHYRIFEAVNIFGIEPAFFLRVQGIWDLVLAALILFAFFPKVVLPVAGIYLLTVAGCGWAYFVHKTGSLFGIAESFRRFPWIFYCLFLSLYYYRHTEYYKLLRIGIAFAFLAHGLASLGLFGLKGAHIELASQIFSEQVANNIVFYSGFTDTFLGLWLLTGFYSRMPAIIGSVWLLVVVYLSLLFGVPEFLFRSGFLLSCIYVAIDKRCHIRPV
ncbi:MAG TPA: DoxX-like family protein [Chitinophagales bacterium]|nr:DoxX-like family protein [Chitinophagales bacterium]HLP50711.1 DoxX-like family protein [Chitinophagales bacterium]